MKNYLNKNLLTVSIIFSALLVASSIVVNYSLDTLQKISSIVGSLSLGVALVTYFYKKRQDELSATIDQIVFFREKIIPYSNEVKKAIMKAYPDFVFSKIDLINPDINYLRDKYSENFKRQQSILIDVSKKYPDVYFEIDILNQQVFLLNMLEELALKVIHLQTKESSALKSIHYAFVEMVEYNALALLFMRDIQSGNSMYAEVLDLYKTWKKEVEEIPFIIKNLEKNGFITKEQREDFYNTRRKKKGY
ncbi:MAG: hypothetical protein U1D31_00400 [Patescibacteria group bacterium]|nr:hypothetical protein [bacterium]MDZ4240581.1 hypothetical protein [Patescibacteria group bacterium]